MDELGPLYVIYRGKPARDNMVQCGEGIVKVQF